MDLACRELFFFKGDKLEQLSVIPMQTLLKTTPFLFTETRETDHYIDINRNIAMDEVQE